MRTPQTPNESVCPLALLGTLQRRLLTPHRTFRMRFLSASLVQAAVLVLTICFAQAANIGVNRDTKRPRATKDLEIASNAKALTNAQRLARGLRPNKPKRLYSEQRVVFGYGCTHPSIAPTRRQGGNNANPSPVP